MLNHVRSIDEPSDYEEEDEDMFYIDGTKAVQKHVTFNNIRAKPQSPQLRDQQQM